MRKSLIGMAICVAAIAAPARVEAQCTFGSTTPLTDGDGFRWDVQQNGSIADGSSDSYDVGWALTVNGTTLPDDTTPTLELGGRQVAHDSTVAGVNVTRRVYVPAAAPGFARLLDSFTNPGTTAVTINVVMSVNMGSDGGTTIIATSSGDTAFSTADRWVRSDDADGTGDPSNGLIFYGTGATVVPTATSTTVYDCAGTQGYQVTYSLTIPAGETRILMHLAVQRNNQAAVATAISTLESAPASPVRDGIALADLPRVVNWSLTPPNLCRGTTTTNLTDGDSFLWDVMQDGSISNGTSDTYDVGWALLVNGAAVPDDTTPTLELGGRQVLHDSAIGGLAIERRTYVPTAAPGFARLVDSFRNTGTTATTITVDVMVNMGSDGGTTLIASSSGDTTFGTDDRWVRTDDTDGASDPSNGLIFWGTGASVTPSSTSTTVFDCAGTQGYAVRYSLTIPPGETRSLMHLAVQRNNQAAVATAISALETAPAALVQTGLAAADLPRIVNWNLVAMPAVCGNSVVETGEACDDGNTLAGDCCSPTCGIEAAGTVCRAAAGSCDVAETCSGTTAVCPTDSFLAAGTTCRGATGSCDVAETCSGTTAVCPTDSFVTAGTTCRGAAGACDVAETCSGTTGACPADAFALDGTSCSNGLVCDGAEVCMAGACADQADPACDDGNACTADACAEPGGCASMAILGCCNADVDCPDDGDVCTVEACSGLGGTCSSTAIAGCCVVDGDCTGAGACETASCDVATNTCVLTPIAGCCTDAADCDDGDACTDDACETDGMCSHVTSAACADAGMSGDDGGTGDDAGVGGDAGGGSDGGTTSGDAGTGVDAGRMRGGSSGGCGCRVDSRSDSGPFAIGLGLALALVIARRRRR